jgi:DHA1 family inner membrane transport protein
VARYGAHGRRIVEVAVAPAGERFSRPQRLRGGGGGPHRRERLALLVDRRALAIVAITTVATAAGILVYTYIAEVLDGVGSLPVALLAWGIGGSTGAFGSGWLADRYGADRTLLLAIGGLGLSLLGLAYANSATVLPLMALYGAAGWDVATPNNHRLVGLASTLPSVVISFNSSGI